MNRETSKVGTALLREREDEDRGGRHCSIGEPSHVACVPMEVVRISHLIPNGTRPCRGALKQQGMVQPSGTHVQTHFGTPSAVADPMNCTCIMLPAVVKVRHRIEIVSTVSASSVCRFSTCILPERLQHEGHRLPVNGFAAPPPKTSRHSCAIGLSHAQSASF